MQEAVALELIMLAIKAAPQVAQYISVIGQDNTTDADVDASEATVAAKRKMLADLIAKKKAEGQA